ncbi:hypothetical protein GSI_06977 [Ganoderma sinense ZZ0214-1]|uniref:HAT C-terminal dimerisation domain-containing protein n=1 Tax=Ganoderma sinense ZZ0214-1 TaxID=1077348 RepID=A0A2G8SAM8_9APHY|nr:hypothetical protein GSI_06977 [Ganoderma sinense ZZ0214-1]
MLNREGRLDRREDKRTDRKENVDCKGIMLTASSTSSSSRPKRHRSSHPEDTATASQADAAVPKDVESTSRHNGVSKRRKPNTVPTGAAAVARGEESNPSKDVVDDQLEPDADATNGGVDAVRACVRRTCKMRLLSTEEKRNRFLVKYAGMTPEQILDAIARGWRSKVYEHFQSPTILRGEQGSVTYRFICKRFPSKHVDHTNYEDSTSNLKCHVDTCDPDPTLESEAITAFANGATYSSARMRFLLAMWCTSCHHPFKVVEDPEFRAMLGMLYGKVQIPSCITVSHDVQLILDETMAQLMDQFENLQGKIHLCVDGWTSPNVMNFLSVTAHWQEAGAMHHIILDFIRLTKSHTSKYLSRKLLECIASINDKMLDEMTKEFLLFRGKKVRVRCFGHVLNLIVKACISGFQGRHSHDKFKNEFETAFCDIKAEPLCDMQELTNDEYEDEVSENEADDAHEQADEEVIASVDNTHPELTDTSDKYAAILKLSAKVWNNLNVRAEMSRLAKEAGLQSEVLVCPITTCWNTICAVLECALDMQEVATELLDPFVFATRQISSSDRALVHEVIPYMDALTEHLDKFSNDESLTPTVHMAAKRRRVVLDKYYGLTNETIIYHIAMILHPRYKMNYFWTQEWLEEWISEAGKAPTSAGPSRVPGRRSAATSSSRALFESIARGPSAENQDALEAYLEAPPLTMVKDPIKYWKLRAQMESNPALARMALDFLSVPATSTDIEHAFSHGCLTMSQLRYVLGNKSMHASTLLGSWVRSPGLVDEGKIVDIIKNSGVVPLATLVVPAAPVTVGSESDSDVEVVAGPSSSSRSVVTHRTSKA